jgi:hypothetical protein
LSSTSIWDQLFSTALRRPTMRLYVSHTNAATPTATAAMIRTTIKGA